MPVIVHDWSDLSQHDAMWIAVIETTVEVSDRKEAVSVVPFKNTLHPEIFDPFLAKCHELYPDFGEDSQAWGTLVQAGVEAEGDHDHGRFRALVYYPGASDGVLEWQHSPEAMWKSYTPTRGTCIELGPHVKHHIKPPTSQRVSLVFTFDSVIG